MRRFERLEEAAVRDEAVLLTVANLDGVVCVHKTESSEWSQL